MRLYLDGKLNKKSMHEVEKHLIECSLCSAAVDGLTPRRMAEINKLSDHIHRRLSVYMNTPPRVPFFRRFGLALIAGFLFLSGGTAIYLYEHSKNSTPVSKDSVSTYSHPAFIAPPGGSDAASLADNSLSAQQVVSSSSGEEPGPNTGSAGNTDDKASSSAATDAGQANVTHTVTPGNAGTGAPSSPPGDNNFHQETPPPADGANSRIASSATPVRVLNVIVYPPVTHSDKKGGGQQSSNDGQLKRSSGSNADFKLDEMPTYPGGDEALREYIMQNFNPVVCDKSKLARLSTGVMFTVNSKTGEISAPELSFSISPQIDAELLRVINSMPLWNPGKKRGEVDVMVGITLG
ncbi:MAG TPA: zf-HC2 domain-containing protein [Bacteroidia bacterium]|nr:zf-HC2 domain-containing protein [Bacteroidia bacterium]